MTPGERQVISLDVGGSSIKSGVVSSGERLVGQVTTTAIDSRADANTILETLAAVVRRHMPKVQEADFLGVAIGMPGPFDYEAGVSRIRNVAKYDSIYGMNVRAELRERLGMPALPIVFRNDAEAAIVGEARYGVGRSYRRLIGITLGTGLGSAFLADGVSVKTGPGVPRDGWLYHVPFRGTPADEIFSTRGLLARLENVVGAHNTVEAFAETARQGHSSLRQGFADFGQDLGEFLTPFAEEFEAEAVLVLGGIGNAIDLFETSLMEQLPVPVLKGELGNRASLLGAAGLLFRRDDELSEPRL